MSRGSSAGPPLLLPLPPLPPPPPPWPLLPPPLPTRLPPLPLPPLLPPPTLLRTSLPLSSRTKRDMRPDGVALHIERPHAMLTFTNERGGWPISILGAQVVLVGEDRVSEVNDRTSRTRFRRCPTHPAAATRCGDGGAHPSRVACSRRVWLPCGRKPDMHATPLASSTRHALDGTAAATPPPPPAAAVTSKADVAVNNTSTPAVGGASRRELPPLTKRERGHRRPAALLAAMISALVIGARWSDRLSRVLRVRTRGWEVLERENSSSPYLFISMFLSFYLS